MGTENEGFVSHMWNGDWKLDQKDIYAIRLRITLHTGTQKYKKPKPM